MLVKFIGDVKKFVGTDLKEYGEFKDGDIAVIPDKNAKVLIDHGLAVELK